MKFLLLHFLKFFYLFCFLNYFIFIFLIIFYGCFPGGVWGVTVISTENRIGKQSSNSDWVCLCSLNTNILGKGMNSHTPWALTPDLKCLVTYMSRRLKEKGERMSTWTNQSRIISSVGIITKADTPIVNHDRDQPNT